jgi:tellurite resistance protein TehA-like permease
VIVIPEIFIVCLYIGVVFVLLYTGVKGLRGRSIWVPNKIGDSGSTARGRAARAVGLIFVLLGLFLLFMPLRAVLSG